MSDLAAVLATDKVSTEESTKAFMYMAFKMYTKKFNDNDAIAFCDSASRSI